MNRAMEEIKIGNQIWLKKNLDVETFRNGDVIPEAKTEEEWEAYGDAGEAAWCYYDNDIINGEKYGKLYNWYAVNVSRGLAPSGYHVPTDLEWTVLADFLGGESVAGGKVKSANGWDNYIKGGSKTCPNCSSWNEEYRKKNSLSCMPRHALSWNKITFWQWNQ